MKDSLEQFQTLKAKLLAEQELLQTRLAAINAVLEDESGPVAKSSWTPPTAPPAIPTASNDSGYTPRPGTLPAKILKALEKNGAALQVKDIAAAVHGRAVLVNQACVMLLKKGRLKREGRGQYFLT